ncbi:hypothetical protein RB614_08340 [Phytohabitans sp. ZYX-F-186]|uniref:Uncharacterized protein n=1 Tax=Phytohabitans maris TaxID=3071409 RepID=A0ABU0ZBU9_9ACTN|nr:hypothetical protein [Phytohabitans sp. ZYX-F-186]MDQ7904531.1 hypothetical protein [Phytohabitans sp. ZYX-F-186]
MIVGSLLLILVAVTLLVLGLANGSSALLISSIAASLLAAAALVVGARQAAAARADAGYADDDERERAGDEVEEAERERRALTAARATEPLARRAGPVYGQASRQSESTMLFESPVAVAEPAVEYPVRQPLDYQPAEAYPPPDAYPPADVSGADETTADILDEDDPPDEPAAQYVSPADAARVARMTADVLVIDGRPRYHLAGCVHLLGRESEPLPVGEAVELGFTPCGRCEPDSALLADARRV